MQRLIWVFALFIWLQAKVPFCDTQPPLILCHSVWKSGLKYNCYPCYLCYPFCDTRPPLILCHSVWKSGLKYNCYPCYLCYLRVTKIHCWEKSSTFWTYMFFDRLAWVLTRDFFFFLYCAFGSFSCLFVLFWSLPVFRHPGHYACARFVFLESFTSGIESVGSRKFLLNKSICIICSW